MSIERIDLNLLKIFNAIFEDGNLLRASKRLNLSQSAVSHALSRLREALEDELFVRTNKGMIPTAKALAIAGTLRDSLSRIDAALGVQPFEPSGARRIFVLAANDHITGLILPNLSKHIATTAAGVDLVVRPSTRLDLAEQIEIGKIDLAIGSFAQVPERMNSIDLLSDGESVLMSRFHPISNRPVTLQDLVIYPLLTVSVGGDGEGAVDGFIFERGLARQAEMFSRKTLQAALINEKTEARFRLTIPHSLAIPALLIDTDMLSIVPTSLAWALSKGGTVVMRGLPYASRTSVLRAVWHHRFDADPAHIWLRETVAATFRDCARDLPFPEVVEQGSRDHATASK